MGGDKYTQSPDLAYLSQKFREASQLLLIAPSDLVSLKVRSLDHRGSERYISPSEYHLFAAQMEEVLVPQGSGGVSFGHAVRFEDADEFVLVAHESGPEFILAIVAGALLSGVIRYAIERFVETIREPGNEHNPYAVKTILLEFRAENGSNIRLCIPLPSDNQPIQIDLTALTAGLTGPKTNAPVSPVVNKPPLAIDFAIITAIEVERRAVCAAFGFGDDHRVKKESRVYWKGQIPLTGGGVYELVVAQAPDMANIDAALLTADALRHWKPGAALLVGIAASTDDKVHLGDVVSGSDVYYYERSKVSSSGTKPEPKMVPADATLWSNVTTVPAWTPKLSVDRPDNSKRRPGVHYGVIASGEKVIADAAVRDGVASGHRKILAIEMEGYGFSRAVWQSFDRVRHLVIRGICDDATSAKSDLWHRYAAVAVADFAKHFLLDRPLDPRNL